MFVVRMLNRMVWGIGRRLRRLAVRAARLAAIGAATALVLALLDALLLKDVRRPQG